MNLTKLKILADMKKPCTLFVKLYGNCYKNWKYIHALSRLFSILSCSTFNGKDKNNVSLWGEGVESTLEPYYLAKLRIKK